MSSFLRRFLFDPGTSVLLNIESVNILDLDPPASIVGIGTGAVLLVGEFEDGPVNTVVEVTSPTDLVNTLGGFGYTYQGLVGNFPCAVARKADGTLLAENWNGNAFIQLNGKQFARLLLCRADTSVGSVSFSPLAFVAGASKFRYTLAPNQVLSLDVGAGFTSATFTATAATVTGAAATYAISAGDTVVLGYDGAPNFTTTFLASDTSVGTTVARINQYAGFAIAANAAGQIALTGIQKGNQAQVRVVSGSAGVLTALGLTAATTAGTGNVGDITAVTGGEVIAVVQAGIANTKVEVDQGGALRASNALTGATKYITVGTATTAADLGFVAGQMGTTLGVAQVLSSGGTQSMALNDTITLGFDTGVNFTTTFAGTENTPALVAAAINSAANATVAIADGTQIRLFGSTPGGQVRVVSALSFAVLSTKLGLAIGVTIGAGMPLGSIPAGTLVQVAGGQQYVTMQAVTFTGAGVTINAGNGATQPVVQPTFGPYPVRVRPAVDDGTGASALVSTVTVIPSAVGFASFSATNPLAINAALSEGAIDAAYAAALGSPTTDINSVARQVNILYCARQSNQVRRAIRANVLLASSSGCLGRVGVVRPPLGTAKALAQSSSAEPGVGAYRDQRVIYTWPQASSFVPLIARRGVAGGAGFTANGVVDLGADGFLASIMSQLPPEENPGQATPFAGGINGLESSTNAQGLQMQDYINMKAAGVCALRMADGAAIFQSGVTSVDPNVQPQLARISRRRMADFIQDTLALRSKAFGKKLSTNVRRKALKSETIAFMEQLLSRANPANQRIAGYTVDDRQNTPEGLGQGLYRIITNVRTLASLDSIVFESTVGEQVQVNEKLAA